MRSTRFGHLWIFGIVSLLLGTTGHAQVRCDRFEIIANLDGHTLTVSLDTDLPDETTLMTSVNRLYWQSGSDDAYSESYLSGRFTVADWRRPRQIDVRDEIWQRALKDRQELLARIGEPFTVRKIQDDIEVDFTVPINQKEPRFGRRNEKLTGSKVTMTTTGLRIIEAAEKIKLPLGISEDAANTKTPVHAHNLKKGKMYRLTDRAPLMPRREGKDIGDISRVRELGEGDIIEVLDKDESGSSPWYRVNAVGKAGERIGTGWINSTALLSHELWEAEKGEPPRDSYKQLGRIDDLSYANVERLSIRIEVPLSRTHEEVEGTLKQAALDLYEKERRRPKAISVFAYMPGDDYESVYTVGKADYAPNGKWEDAAQRAPMKFSVDLGTAYFEVSKLAEKYGRGTEIQLKSPSGDAVKISGSTDDWSDRQIIESVPPETPVEVVDYKVWALTSTNFTIWYRVKLQHRGRVITGWVRRSNVEE